MKTSERQPSGTMPPAEDDSIKHSASNSGQAIPLLWATLSVLSLILFLVVIIRSFDGTGHIPLIAATAVAATIGRLHEWSWESMHQGMLRGIGLAMGAILILLTIGMLMGSWIASGIVPAMISWGLDLLSPTFFLPAACVICACVSLISGSSWSTAGTVGVALIGVGQAMSLDPAICAGAIISGAYFGDKLSPMSDTTNLAPAMAGAELFPHIRHMLWTTVPALLISLVAYSFMGWFNAPSDTGTVGSIAELNQVLAENFRPGALHLVVPLLVLVLVLIKVPALPALLFGVLGGGMLAVLNNGMAFGDLLGVIMGGYESSTGHAGVDDLLSRGGMESMASTVFLIICAMCFGGVMESTGQLRVLASAMLRFSKSQSSLIISTILTSIGVNILAADQYISVVVPGRMYASAYREQGLDPINLSRALEDGGTITSPLIPWNTCGAFMATTLQVATGAYLPYCFLNLLNPLIGMFYGLSGWTVKPDKRASPTG